MCPLSVDSLAAPSDERPIIERRFLSPVKLRFVDRDGKQVTGRVPSEQFSFSRLHLPALEYEKENHAWSKPLLQMAYYDTGAWVSVLPREVLQEFGAKTHPVQPGGLSVELRGAFEKAGATAETCELCHVVLGFPGFPQWKFPVLCAVSQRRKVPLISHDALCAFFTLDPVIFGRSFAAGERETVEGFALTLRDGHRAVPRDQPFIAPAFFRTDGNRPTSPG